MSGKEGKEGKKGTRLVVHHFHHICHPEGAQRPKDLVSRTNEILRFAQDDNGRHYRPCLSVDFSLCLRCSKQQHHGMPPKHIKKPSGTPAPKQPPRSEEHTSEPQSHP